LLTASRQKYKEHWNWTELALFSYDNSYRPGRKNNGHNARILLCSVNLQLGHGTREFCCPRATRFLHLVLSKNRLSQPRTVRLCFSCGIFAALKRQCYCPNIKSILFNASMVFQRLVSDLEGQLPSQNSKHLDSGCFKFRQAFCFQSCFPVRTSCHQLLLWVY